MQKKDDKVGNKTANIKKVKKKKARGKDRNRFAKKVQILAFAQEWKTKKLFNYVRLVGKYVFFLEKLVFSHSYAN